MQWHFQELEYDILIPISFGKHIFYLNKKEAAAYFEWFMEKIPERVAYVSKICAKELQISEDKMDCSPESLLLLWKWFLQRAKKEEVPHTHKENSNQSPNNIWTNKYQLTLETEYILRDIGMYVGETFCKNHSQIYWTYYTKPRNDFFVNYPLLKGFVEPNSSRNFEPVFEPIHMARMQAVRILDDTSKDTDLFNVYQIWRQKTKEGSKTGYVSVPRQGTIRFLDRGRFSVLTDDSQSN